MKFFLKSSEMRHTSMSLSQSAARTWLRFGRLENTYFVLLQRRPASMLCRGKSNPAHHRRET
jgi:hypothetical protein